MACENCEHCNPPPTVREVTEAIEVSLENHMGFKMNSGGDEFCYFIHQGHRYEIRVYRKRLTRNG